MSRLNVSFMLICNIQISIQHGVIDTFFPQDILWSGGIETFWTVSGFYAKLI